MREHETADGRVFEVHCDPVDLGRLIGRGGRTVRALRAVARAAAPPGERLTLEIVDAAAPEA